MQEQYENLEEELNKTKKDLAVAEEEKFRVIDELREMKRVAETANTNLSEALSAQPDETSRVNELEHASIESAKKRDQAWQLELEAVQNQHASDIQALSSASQELQRLRQELSSAIKAKDEAIREVSEVRSKTEELKSTESRTFKELEHELEKVKESEAKTSQALFSQTKQFEETKILLEEAKEEIASLTEKIQSLEDSVAQRYRDLDVSHRCLEKAKLDTHSMKEVVETLKTQLHAAKEGHAHSQEGEELAMSKVRRLTQEISLLKAEVKLATDAEEKSKKAMDDLALVVVEVSQENKELKEQLNLSKAEIASAKEEAKISKQMMKPTEDKYQSLLESSKKEMDQLRSVSERLKLEAEDSILAWNQKELEFVNCIKKTDEESDAIKHENSKLKVSLRMVEEAAKVAREENCKLRDILKQALNETTAAKEAAAIAKEENSELKDNLLDKDDILQELTRENERLRIKETAGYETIKELKKMLSTKSVKDVKEEDLERETPLKKQNSLMAENKDLSPTIKDILSIKFEEPKIRKESKDEDEDPEMAEMLKGSIFDVMDSPVAPKPAPLHRKTSSSVFSDEGDRINLEDIEHLEAAHLDDTEDKNCQRKKRALLRRFGELIMKRNLNFHHRRESSVG